MSLFEFENSSPPSPKESADTQKQPEDIFELSEDANELLNIPGLKELVEHELRENNEAVIDFAKEVSEFVRMCKDAPIDGSYSPDERGVEGSATWNAVRLAKQIGVMSEKLHAMVNEPPQTLPSGISAENMRYFPIEFHEKCKEYIEKHGVKKMVMLVPTEDERFDTHNMRALESGSENRYSIAKVFSWTVKYTGVVLEPAKVETK